MKKMIVILGLLGSYAASAQYNDFLDDQLKLRRKGTKQPPIGLSLPAMQNKPVVHPPVIRAQNCTPKSNIRLLIQLPDGSNVYALPQDHMPCIIPDMSQFNMPNKATGLPLKGYPQQPGAIPNPSASRT